MPPPPQGAASLLASLPATLGRPPGPRELILLGWSPMDEDHVAVVTLPLGESEPREEVAAVRQLVIDGAEDAAAVLYVGRWVVADAIGTFLGACAYRYGLDLRDVIAVVEDRWRSVGCRDSSCCPLEGRPIPTPATPTPTEENP